MGLNDSKSSIPLAAIEDHLSIFGVPMYTNQVKNCHVIKKKIKKIKNNIFYITWCSVIDLRHEDLNFLENGNVNFLGQVILIRDIPSSSFSY
ncbi:hypothetical protein Lalb_Chr20g0111491 [Lupinus albus]|uniref:Uncharacterized protein n=1 Tax=Lupinus albus TaxID=3870 RepID=A0A6A4NFC8_LUPAL|nr:hypothetical protein Lalb_Chr20g0111491 [Lupinus albus]